MSATIVSLQEKDLRKFAAAIQGLAAGRSNATGTFTLTANTTTTNVPAPNCAIGSVVLFDPQTANAAAAKATSYVKVADTSNGSFIVTHASTTTTDRTFGFIAVG